MNEKEIEQKVEGLWANKRSRRMIVIGVVVVLIVASVAYHLLVGSGAAG